MSGDQNEATPLARYRTLLPSPNPLRKLPRSKVTWEWGEQQEESLKKLHDLLQSQRVMADYDHTKYTELRVDASPVGLGAILAKKSLKIRKEAA